MVKHPAHMPSAAAIAKINTGVFMAIIISDLGLTCHGLFSKISGMGKFWDKLCQIFFFIAFGAVLVIGAIMSYPKYDQAQGLSRQRDEIRQRIEEKKREIAAIRDRQRRFTTDREFVEALARENRRVFPNELVFVFEN